MKDRTLTDRSDTDRTRIQRELEALTALSMYLLYFIALSYNISAVWIGHE